MNESERALRRHRWGRRKGLEPNNTNAISFFRYITSSGIYMPLYRFCVCILSLLSFSLPMSLYPILRLHIFPFSWAIYIIFHGLASTSIALVPFSQFRVYAHSFGIGTCHNEDCLSPATKHKDFSIYDLIFIILARVIIRFQRTEKRYSVSTEKFYAMIRIDGCDGSAHQHN